MNSTPTDLKTERFVALQFICKDCRRETNCSLDTIKFDASLKQLASQSICSACGGTTRYLKPLQSKHWEPRRSKPLQPSAGSTSLAGSTGGAAPLENQDGSVGIFKSYEAYVRDRAQQNIRQKFLLEGKRPATLSRTDLDFLIATEVGQIKAKHLKVAGVAALSWFTGGFPVLTF